MSRAMMKIFLILLILVLLFISYLLIFPNNSQSPEENMAKVPELAPSEQVDLPPLIEVDRRDLTIYYLGYGSNMNAITMKSRCGNDNYIDLGRAILEGYQFYFFHRGFANIKPNASQRVEGVLYQINKLCLQALDRAEGYPTFYQRQAVEIFFEDKKINAEVYIVQDDDTTGLPSDTYYHTVITGAQEHDLSLEYIKYIKSMAGRLESS